MRSVLECKSKKWLQNWLMNHFVLVNICNWKDDQLFTPVRAHKCAVQSDLTPVSTFLLLGERERASERASEGGLDGGGSIKHSQEATINHTNPHPGAGLAATIAATGSWCIHWPFENDARSRTKSFGMLKITKSCQWLSCWNVYHI